MLAAMTSLIALAYAAHPAQPPFNADFYVAAITVIPVLYLALTIQGPTAARMIKAAADSDGKVPGSVTFLLLLVPMCVYMFGGFGEFVGIVALYNRRDYGWGFITLWALILLTVIAVVVPASAALREAATTTHPQGPSEAPPAAADPSREQGS